MQIIYASQVENSVLAPAIEEGGHFGLSEESRWREAASWKQSPANTCLQKGQRVVLKPGRKPSWVGWVELGQLPGPHPTMLSLGERIRKKIVDQDGQGEYLPITIMGKTHSAWRKLIYCESRQSWWVRSNDKLNHPALRPLYPPFSQAQCHTVPSSLPSNSEGCSSFSTAWC